MCTDPHWLKIDIFNTPISLLTLLQLQGPLTKRCMEAPEAGAQK